MPGGVSTMSRAQFIKLFLDLIDKRFLRSESDDILNVNTKIALAFSEDDFRKILLNDKNLTKMELPHSITNFAK